MMFKILELKGVVPARRRKSVAATLRTEVLPAVKTHLKTLKVSGHDPEIIGGRVMPKACENVGLPIEQRR